jgi:Domain of unknown function (DUF5753)
VDAAAHRQAGDCGHPHPELRATAVVGLLQTEGYVDALLGDWLSGEDRTHMISSRMERQRLLDTDREFILVMSEGALRWNMGGAAVMVEQLDRLIHTTPRYCATGSGTATPPASTSTPTSSPPPALASPNSACIPLWSAVTARKEYPTPHHSIGSSRPARYPPCRASGSPNSA